MRKNLTGRPIIMISLDAISDNDINYLLTLPNFKKLASWGLLHRGVVSLFISNTFPVSRPESFLRNTGFSIMSSTTLSRIRRSGAHIKNL